MFNSRIYKPLSRLCTFFILEILINTSFLTAGDVVNSKTGVSYGSDLQTAINEAGNGNVLTMIGTFSGNFYIINKSLVLKGSTSQNTTLNANKSGIALTISQNKSSNKITIENLIIKNGSNPGGGGGGIFQLGGELTITSSIITANLARYGAGIYYVGSYLEINGSTIIEKNQSEEDGGGIYFEPEKNGVGFILLSSISQNKALKSGGGIFHRGGTLKIYASIIKNNEANEGAGMYLLNTKATIYSSSSVPQKSTIDSNKSINSGGGIFQNGGFLSIENSTQITKNASIDASGGGIYIINGSKAKISSSSITGNSAKIRGGGVYYDATSSFTQKKSTIADNTPDEIYSG